MRYLIVLIMAALSRSEALREVPKYFPFELLSDVIDHHQKREVMPCEASNKCIGDYNLPLFAEELLTEELLNSRCSTGEAIVRCLTKENALCARRGVSVSFGTVYSQSIQSAIDYMCSEEGRRLALSEAHCWTEVEMPLTLHIICSMNGTSSDNQCRSAERWRECARNTVGDRCGANTVVYIDNIIYRAMIPYETRRGCTFEEPVRIEY